MARLTHKLQRKPMAEINVVPYIDVMLVLLVIFMITAPLLNQGVSVNLPHAVSKPIAPKEKPPIIISVDSAGNYYLNIATKPKAPLMAAQLIAQLKQALADDHAKHQRRQVLVKGDDKVTYGKVMQAMSLIQAAGVDAVGLLTAPLKNPG